jgi:hypothetical protein
MIKSCYSRKQPLDFNFNCHMCTVSLPYPTKYQVKIPKKIRIRQKWGDGVVGRFILNREVWLLADQQMGLHPGLHLNILFPVSL